jgi:hypothetical protein
LNFDQDVKTGEMKQGRSGTIESWSGGAIDIHKNLLENPFSVL